MDPLHPEFSYAVQCAYGPTSDWRNVAEFDAKSEEEARAALKHRLKRSHAKGSTARYRLVLIVTVPQSQE